MEAAACEVPEFAMRQGLYCVLQQLVDRSMDLFFQVCNLTIYEDYIVTSRYDKIHPF